MSKKMTEAEVKALEDHLDKLQERIDKGEDVYADRVDDPEDHVINGKKLTPIPLQEAASLFNLDKHLIDLMRDVPFFATISRWIRKIPTYGIPTAGVTHNMKTDELTLYYNPTFFKPSLVDPKEADMSADEVRGVLVHEFYHLIFNHVTNRRRDPHAVWNIATDLAINSIIVNDNKGKLPAACLMPGQLPVVAKGRKLTKEEENAAGPIAQLIKSFPHSQASEWYFERIIQEAEKNGIDTSSLGSAMGSMDDHDMWDDVPEETRDRISGKIKSIMERAAKHADSMSNGWGSIPAHIREEIRRAISNVVDWKALLRQFVGYCFRGNRANSMKRINKRFPYIHPGQKRGYVAKLLVAIDQSGSVDDGSLAVLAGELNNLTKNVTIDVCTFDTEIDEKDMYTWRKGQQFSGIKRTRCGGTDFNAPTNFVNDPKNRGRWDGLLIATDGECSAPGPSSIRRAYVIVPGRKLNFETTDLTITMDDGKKFNGAWR